MAVAIDVPYPEAVFKTPAGLIAGNGVPLPRLGGVLPRLVVTVLVVMGTDDFREAAGDDVRESGRLVTDLRGDDVHLPGVGGTCAGIKVEAGFFPWETVDEDVVFAVLVGVSDVGEEVVGVSAAAIERIALGEAVFGGVGWSLEPERPVSDVRRAVAVDIAVGSTFCVEVGFEEGGLPGLGRRGGEDGEEKEWGKVRTHREIVGVVGRGDLGKTSGKSKTNDGGVCKVAGLPCQKR